jgi:hypothetical protein
MHRGSESIRRPSSSRRLFQSESLQFCGHLSAPPTALGIDPDRWMGATRATTRWSLVDNEEEEEQDGRDLELEATATWPSDPRREQKNFQAAISKSKGLLNYHAARRFKSERNFPRNASPCNGTCCALGLRPELNIPLARRPFGCFN